MIVPISLVFSIPIFMNYKYSDIKKTKFKIPYLVIMTILYIIDMVFVSIVIFEFFYSSAYMIGASGIKVTISKDVFQTLKEFNVIFSPLLFMVTSWLMLFVNFSEIDKKESRTNYFLTILSCVVIILIHINFYMNPYLRPEINLIRVDERAPYITQNYIYFTIMYGVIIMKKFLNKGRITIQA